MTLSEFQHMKQVHDYVFSSPPNSAERERRLKEISKEDDEKLWDFHSGLLSGRIQCPKLNKESEVIQMDETKKIRNFEQFKQAWGKTKYYQQLAELHRRCPELYDSYQERMKREQLKANDPVSYYLQHGGNLNAREV